MHTIFRPSKFFETYRLMGVESVISVAFYPIKPKHSATLEDLFRWIIERETRRLQEIGITCFCGIGIHPRSIPDILNPSIYDYINKNLRERVVALGEIGLEKGTKEEIKVLEELLLIAKRNNDFPVILHTPGKNRRKITKQLIDVTESLDIISGVIDHVSSENIDLALDTKLNIGLTIQKGKLTKEQFIDIIQEYKGQTNRFILNSDLGIDVAFKYGVPEVVQYMIKKEMEKEVIEKISHKNAESIFKLNEKL